MNNSDQKPTPRKHADPTTPVPSEPALPHERDESTSMTGGVPSEVVQQGARDLTRGLEDTSRAPEADRAYKKLKK
ncbi:MAG: hypothetical protein Q8R33_03825 [Burkholderiales bacterium]|nr:hypothetical protein [Burkholderiales bacterium]